MTPSHFDAAPETDRLITSAGNSFLTALKRQSAVVGVSEEMDATDARSLLISAFEAMTDGVIMYGNDGHIVHMNAAACRILELDGVLESEPVMTAHEEAWRLDQSIQQRRRLFHVAERVLEQSLDGKAPDSSRASDLRITTVAGHDVTTVAGHDASLSGYVRPMRDAWGHVMGSIVVIRENATHEQIKRAKPPREQRERVAERQDAMLHSDEFFALAAHEMRNVAMSLCGYVNMLSACATPEKPSRLTRGQIETIQEVEHAAECMAELTGHIADVIRVQAGRFELRFHGADLVALARRVARRLQVTTQRHEIAVLASSESIIAQIDIRRIEQALTNLIGNAIKYSPDRGEIAVRVWQDRRTGQAFIAVRDHGIGIPVDQRGQIFQRFGRASNARDLGVEGTGLGLYLCREIIERHGGRIWFRANAGGGTTFSISLPLAAEAYAAAYEI